jgi:hypothetical protein
VKGGHNRKTPEQHRAAGTYRSDRHGGDVVNFADVAPSCPASLSPEARKQWFAVCGELQAAGTLKRAYSAAIAAYCVLYAAFLEDPPAFSRDSHTQLRQYIALLGLAPAAVGRVRADLRPHARPPKRDKDYRGFDDLDA